MKGWLQCMDRIYYRCWFQQHNDPAHNRYSFCACPVSTYHCFFIWIWDLECTTLYDNVTMSDRFNKEINNRQRSNPKLKFQFFTPKINKSKHGCEKLKSFYCIPVFIWYLVHLRCSRTPSLSYYIIIALPLPQITSLVIVGCLFGPYLSGAVHSAVWSEGDIRMH